MYLTMKKSGGWGFVVRDKNRAAVMAGAGRLDSVLDAFCKAGRVSVSVSPFHVTSLNKHVVSTHTFCLAEHPSCRYRPPASS